ncbi:MAG: TolC family protein, partial [Succinivibrio sp.]
EIEELNFVKDYINAVQEVYDCIYDVSLYRKNLRLSRQTYQLSERNYQRYFERYSAGLVDLNDFLTASDTMRNARISFLEAKRNNLTSMMSLMTALGGDNRNQIEEIVK